MAKSSDGRVTYSPDRCIGCWTCVMVCGYGALRRVVTPKPSILKCDLCAGRKVPACVEHCPNGALEVMEA
jgi:carbon-monoxide dehydrogenase iron sulfur subunit